VDLLSEVRWLAVAGALAVLLGGCGGGKPATQEPLPPAASVPTVAPPTQRTAPTPRHRVRLHPAAEAESAADAAAVGGSGGPIPARDVADFARLQQQLGGQIGLAVSGIGLDQPVQTLGPLQSAIAWSTSKVPIAMAIYAANLAGSHQQDLVAAIQASDNAAAERLWSALGGGAQAARAADAQLRAAGDTQTSVQATTLRPGYTPFGQTVWPLSAQTRFTAGMACLAAGGPVLGLMDGVVPAERWGLGDAGVSAQFKGGWGPGSQPGTGGGYLDRQMGIVTVRGTPIALSIASLPADGSHGSGTSALTAIARWVVAHVRVAGLPQRAACG
jgi:hypothetical protein